MIAGAGSGKTTVMAARVVWLVAHRPGRARRGARPDLHHQGHRRAAPPGSASRSGRPGCCPPATVDRAVDADGRGGRGAHRRDLQRLRRRPAHRARPADRPRARHPGDRRRRRATSWPPAWSTAHTGAGRAAQRPPQPRDRSTCSPSTPRCASTSSTPTTCARSTPRSGRVRRREDERRPRPARPTVERNEKAITAIDRRARAARPGRGLPRPQAPTSG